MKTDSTQLKEDSGPITSLRAQVSQLHSDLVEVTAAYRQALANRDRQKVIPLLRTRGQLMRQLLECQCELLLAIRKDESPGALDASNPVMQGFKSMAANGSLKLPIMS